MGTPGMNLHLKDHLQAQNSQILPHSIWQKISRPCQTSSFLCKFGYIHENQQNTKTTFECESTSTTPVTFSCGRNVTSKILTTEYVFFSKS